MAKENKVTKQFILDHLDDSELDLSLCYLTTVPVKELVSYLELYRINAFTELFCNEV